MVASLFKKFMSHLNRLTEIISQELSEAFGLQNLRYGKRLAKALLWLPARRTSKTIIEYDRLVGESNLSSGVNFLAQIHTKQILPIHVENIPKAGPVVVLANHPGLTDAVSLLSAVPRDDWRILGLKRSLLAEIPETEKYMIYLSEDGSNQFAAMQAMIKHLAQGGILLIFPSGKIEPDPAALPGAKESLASWPENLSVFAHLSSKPTFVPTLISGVFSSRALRNPLIRVRKERQDREWLAAYIQVIWPFYRNVRVRVQFGDPISAEKLKDQGDSKAILRFIQQRMAQLIDKVED